MQAGLIIWSEGGFMMCRANQKAFSALDDSPHILLLPPYSTTI